MFYRWSLKGIALIYSPLIWIVHSATARSLRDIHELALHRIFRWYAVFVLLLFAAKVYIYYAWSDSRRRGARSPATSCSTPS